MIEAVDKLLAEQKKKNKKLRENRFWGRNKKLIKIIALVLIALYIFSLIYTYYWLPQIYKMTSEL
jgi:hypothetical protein